MSRNKAIPKEEIPALNELVEKYRSLPKARQIHVLGIMEGMNLAKKIKDEVQITA